MNPVDFLFVIKWWLVFLIIGIIFLPLTAKIFSRFFDLGYIFSKIFALIFISYAVFLFGILKIIPFTFPFLILIILGFLIFNFYLFSKNFKDLVILKNNWRIFAFEELLFLSTLIFWSYVRGFAPDIHGLEKYMDFGFVNSILRSDYFPPKDMWLTPFPINYYYFGHLVTAVLTKLSDILSIVTYNLMLATIFALTFTASFSIGANLISKLNVKHYKLYTIRYKLYVIISGLTSAFLVTLAGNLHTIYTLFKPYSNENPVPFWQLLFAFDSFPNSYWYPNATRFIYNTIHEFPIYSFVVSDLHGHVLDIPIVLLTIAILLSLIFNFQFSIFNQIKNSKNQNSFQISNFKFQIVLLGFLLAVMYMTNVWDGIIYALLILFVFFYLASCTKNYTLYAIRYTLVILGFILFSLPFNLNFKPFASGIGILCAPTFLTDIGKIGPFLFEANHCQKSPFWQFLILYGFFYFWIISFLIYLFKIKSLGQRPISLWLKKPKINFNFIRNLKLEIRNSLFPSDLFILILIFLSTLLIIIPEFIYAKDIYPAHYRANTMFKLVYQSFIMLSISSGYITIRIVSSIKYQVLGISLKKNLFAICYLLLATCLLFLVSIYPFFAINSYYGDLQIYKGLNGLSYLKSLYPTDYEAILWLNKNIKGQPVILEAQGDSYTDFARVSANTGLSTVLGWTVHEWLWRGTYDIPAPRIPEVATLYETSDMNSTTDLIKKYNISLVFIGDLERQKYPKLNEQKFQTLGKIIFQGGNTKIYKIN
ncbi:MAG: DUF2298 domain-containing protein [Candidatus Levyibacteriota bacterium]